MELFSVIGQYFIPITYIKILYDEYIRSIGLYVSEHDMKFNLEGVLLNRGSKATVNLENPPRYEGEKERG